MWESPEINCTVPPNDEFNRKHDYKPLDLGLPCSRFGHQASRSGPQNDSVCLHLRMVDNPFTSQKVAWCMPILWCADVPSVSIQIHLAAWFCIREAKHQNLVNPSIPPNNYFDGWDFITSTVRKDLIHGCIRSKAWAKPLPGITAAQWGLARGGAWGYLRINVYTYRILEYNITCYNLIQCLYIYIYNCIHE